MRQPIWTTLLFTASLLLGASGRGAEAQQDDLDAMTLEELLNVSVEAATRTDVRYFEVPQAITVLRREDIERIPATSLADLLRSVAGSNVVRLHSSQTVLGARGSNAFTPSKILILIDGQPIDTTLFSTTWWELVPVSLHDIERLEFIRSPGTIYGANAQNGVMNIITGRATLSDPDDISVEVYGRAGQQNRRQVYAGLQGKRGQTLFRASFESDKVDAYRDDSLVEIVPGKPIGGGEQTFADSRNQLDTLNFSGRLVRESSIGTFSASVGYKDIVNAQGRVPDRLCFVGSDGGVGYLNLDYAFATASLRHTVSVGEDRIHFSFNRNSGSELMSPAAMNLRRTGLRYELAADPGDDHSLRFGLDYALESASNESGVPFLTEQTVNREAILQARVQDEWRLSDHDTLYLGGLLSDHYVGGTQFAPLAAYVHEFGDDHVLRAATFTSYRNPNVFEHSMDYDQTTGEPDKITRLVSNRNLLAERTVSYELGFRSRLAENLFWSADFYVNEITDGVEWTLLGVDPAPARPRYLSENSLDQTIRGLDVWVRYELSPQWSLENSFSLADITNRSSKPEYQGDGAGGVNGVGEGRYGEEYVPPFIYSAVLKFTEGRVHTFVHYQYTAAHTWQWPSWKESTGLDALSLKPVPAYSLLDAQLSVDVTSHVRLLVEGYNLLGNLHTEWRGDKSFFGRSFWTGFRFRL